VLEQGRIEAAGDHATLLRQQGRYADAWRRQTEASALEAELPPAEPRP
jgi:ABC-type multidrug transport system fused ATPase/permease subunit